MSCTGCYWWLGDGRSYMPVFSFVWVLTIWYSLALVLWLSMVLESVLPLQSLKAWSLSKDQLRSNLPRGISPKMKGPLLEFQKPMHKNTTEISDSAETQYCLPHGQASLDYNRCLESLFSAVISRTLPPSFMFSPLIAHLKCFSSLHLLVHISWYLLIYQSAVKYSI